MQIRDRIKEFRRVPASDLRPNPKNWRTHPPAQQDALRGVLAEIGYAGTLLARELADGTLELIDGHLRAQTTPDVTVPVLILDLSSAEADTLLATLDPLGAMAGVDPHSLDSLLADVHTDNAALQAMLDQVKSQAQTVRFSQQRAQRAQSAVDVPALFQIVVECGDEEQQKQMYDRLTAEGFKCRVLTL